MRSRYYYYRPKENKWQTRLIKELFGKENGKECSFTKLVLQNIAWINSKGKYLPNQLYKFYSPSPENVDDTKNQVLWLSDPINFNDPFDCQIGYDSEKYEKSCILDFAQKQKSTNNNFDEILSDEEIKRIKESKLGEIGYWDTKSEEYNSVIYDVLKNKKESFSSKIKKYLFDKKQNADLKVDQLKKINIRVACFSNLEYDNFQKQLSMWAHYADNHRGFCVEYNIKKLQEEIELSTSFSSFYKEEQRSTYLDERVKIITKAGLFPVQYTSERVNIPMKILRQSRDMTLKGTSTTRSINELIFKTYIVKSPTWNYEKEWRLIVDNGVCQYYDNKIPFPYIKTIYVGCRANNELENKLKKIGDKLGIEVIKLQMHGGKFIIEPYYNWDSEFERKHKKERNPFGYY